MAINQADEKDFQPISEESSSQAHQEELVMMGPERTCNLKRPRNSDSEEPISTSRYYNIRCVYSAVPAPQFKRYSAGKSI